MARSDEASREDSSGLEEAGGVPALLQAQHTHVQLGMRAHTQGNVWVCVCAHMGACVCQWVCIHVIQSPCVFVWFSVSPLPGTDPIPAARCRPGVRTSAPGFLSSPLWPQALLRAGAAGEHVCDRTPESASLGVWPCLSPRMLGLPQGPGSCLERALPRRGVSECGRLGGERSLYGSQHSPCYVCQ